MTEFQWRPINVLDGRERGDGLQLPIILGCLRIVEHALMAEAAPDA